MDEVYVHLTKPSDLRGVCLSGGSNKKTLKITMNYQQDFQLYAATQARLSLNLVTIWLRPD
ncbi:hypothetical protein GCM10011328_31980 [Hafnia psychrotolerans]|uniref:Uncharacterized protein n=1 Tax=Hafnia psychrotolerans TaxID=1477018 RepID=A0ABQ1GZX9_9GAMM|nr:hypothetical protein GCM10011328_31980 [Hafnia psychrotolerans]